MLNSHIPDWLSDNMCSISTGEGFRKRELWTDADETIIAVRRPQILNSIEDPTYRGDFLDRELRVVVSEIPEDKRLEDEEVESRFRKALPDILGALLTVLSEAKRLEKKVILKKKPRMADFAVFGVAIEEVLGYGKGSFIKAYNTNRQQVNNLVIAANPIGWCLMRLLRQHKNVWIGTNGELLKALNEALQEDTTGQFRNPKNWPKNIAELSGALRRIKPALRKKGVTIEHKHKNDASRLTITYVPKAKKK